MKKFFLLLVMLLNSQITLAEYKDILFVNGAGTATCGDALSESDRDVNYDSYYVSYIQGYMTGRNNASLKNRLVGDGISGNTLSILWKTKCKKEVNITKPFFAITEEIYSDLLKK